MKKILLSIIAIIWITNLSYWFIHIEDNDCDYWYILDQDNNLVKFDKDNDELIKIWTDFKSFDADLTKKDLLGTFWKKVGYWIYKIFPSLKDKKVSIPNDFFDLVNYIQTSNKTSSLVHSILEEFNNNNISSDIFYKEKYDPYYDYSKINNYNFYLTLDFWNITDDLGENITTDFKENKIKELYIRRADNIKNNFTFTWTFDNLTKIELYSSNKDWTISFDWTYNNDLTVEWNWRWKVDFSKIEDKVKELEIDNAPWYLNLWNYSNLTKLSIENYYNSILLDKSITNLSNKLQYLKFRDDWHNYEIDYSKMNDDDSFTIPWTDNGVDYNYNIIIKKGSDWLDITAEKIEETLPFYDENFKKCLDDKYNVLDADGNKIDLGFVEDEDDDWNTIWKISNTDEIDNIVKINCSKYSISDLRWINNFKNLEDLTLGGRSSYHYNGETADLSWLKKLKNVSIDAGYNKLKNISLPDSIESLKLEGTTFSNLDFLKNLSKLKELLIKENNKTLDINDNLPQTLENLYIQSEWLNLKIDEINNDNLPNLKTLSLYNSSTTISSDWLNLNKDLDDLYVQNLTLWNIYWNITNFIYRAYNLDTNISIIWNWNTIKNFWIYSDDYKISLYFDNVTIKNFWIRHQFYSTRIYSNGYTVYNKYMAYKIPIIDSDNDWNIDSYFKLSSSEKGIYNPLRPWESVVVRPVDSVKSFWNKYEISSDITYKLFHSWTIKEWNQERQEGYAIYYDKENNKYYYVDNEVDIANITYMNNSTDFSDILWLWNFSWLTYLKIKLKKDVNWLDELYNLTNMKEAYFSYSPWLTDTNYLKNMKDLEKLEITYTYKNIDLWWLQYLTNLTHLDLRSNKIDNLPSDIWNLTNLTHLDLRSNKIDNLPSDIWNLTNLTYLNLGSNKISSLPSEMWNLTNLTYLNLQYNDLTEVPDLGSVSDNFTTSYCYDYSNVIILCNNEISNADNLSNYTKLKKIDLYNNSLTTFNPDLSSLSDLTYISLKNNSLKSLGNNILDLDWKLKYLYLYWNSDLGNLNRNLYYNDKNIYSENVLDTDWDGEPDTNLSVEGDGDFLKIYK